MGPTNIAACLPTWLPERFRGDKFSRSQTCLQVLIRINDTLLVPHAEVEENLVLGRRGAQVCCWSSVALEAICHDIHLTRGTDLEDTKSMSSKDDLASDKWILVYVGYANYLSEAKTRHTTDVQIKPSTRACCFWAHWPRIPFVMLIVVVPSGHKGNLHSCSKSSAECPTWRAFLRICEDEMRRLLLSGSKNNTRMVLTLAFVHCQCFNTQGQIWVLHQ